MRQNSDRGASAVEYGLIITGIAAIIVVSLALLGGGLNGGYGQAADALPPTTGVAAASGSGTADGGAAGSTGAQAGGGTSGGDSGGAAAGDGGARESAPVGDTGHGAGDGQTPGAGQSGTRDNAGGDTKPIEATPADPKPADPKPTGPLTKTCEPGRVTGENGECQDGPSYCAKSGAGYDKASNACVPSAEKSCIGDQKYDSRTNTCLIPRCAPDRTAYDASSGRCVESLKYTTCAPSKMGYDAATNSCVPCGAGVFDEKSVTCAKQVDCSATNQIPDERNQCQAPAYLSSWNWYSQKAATTVAYPAFPDEDWPYLKDPYRVRVVDATILGSSWSGRADGPKVSYSDDSVLLSTPDLRGYGFVNLEYTVEIAYPWNGTTKTATTTSRIMVQVIG